MASSKCNVETLIKHAASTIGEGPHWEEKTGKLLYVDILSNDVYRHDVETGDNEKMHLDGSTSIIVPAEDGGYIASSLRKLCHLDWETKTVTDILEVPSIGSNDRFNDGKCDSNGRLWAGTMGHESKPAVNELEKGCLYKLDKGKEIHTMVEGVSISNGLAWTADNTVMYYIDSIPRHVYAYDFDQATGSISNKRIAVDFNQWSIDDAGFPDGMTIDIEGKLWVAGYMSSKVLQFDPVTGAKIRQVTVPGKRTTSCCFGGRDYTEMFVTSGRAGWTEEEFQQLDPLAGSVFKVTGLGVKGLPAPSYRC